MDEIKLTSGQKAANTRREHDRVRKEREAERQKEMEILRQALLICLQNVTASPRDKIKAAELLMKLNGENINAQK